MRPGHGALTLLERLRHDDPGLRAIIMSGHLPDHAGIAEARARGGVAYVGKPVDLDELLRTLGQLVRAAPEPGAPGASPVSRT